MHLRLYRPTYAPGLPEVASLVSRDDVEACGKAETDTSDEGIWKAYAG
jgi:hypothetical protein